MGTSTKAEQPPDYSGGSGRDQPRPIGRPWHALPAWLWPVLLAVPLRWPLVTLPGPGRDEAAYAYWAHHPEPAYAPLLQILVRAGESLGLPGLWALRLPPLLLGLGLLVLLDRHWTWLGLPKPGRVIALLCLALTAWQSYVGAILHPDMPLLVALILFVAAAARGRLLCAAAAVGLAVWAKPTGLLLLPALFWLTLTARSETPARRALALGLAMALSAPVLLNLKVPMIREMAAFGRMDGTSLTGKALWAGGRIMLQVGWLLPLAGVVGLRQRLFPNDSGAPRTTLSARHAAERRVVLVVAGLFAVVFGAAALLNGQIKENWIFPALVALWPLRPLRIGRMAPILLLLPALAGAVLQATLLPNPSLAARIEVQGGALIPPYAVAAGSRESRVAPARTWSERCREYQPLPEWTGEATRRIAAAGGGEGPPRLIVSSDYGLAARLAWEWRSVGPRVVILDDGIFWRTLVQPEPPPLASAGLLIGPADPPSALGFRRGTPLGTLPDSQSGEPVLLALLEPAPPADLPESAPAPTPAATAPPPPPATLHADFSRLLAGYVTPNGVRYAAWHAATPDHRALADYVARLEALDPDGWPRRDALAYWINLYNAVTLRLILDNYPVRSIKDINSPWTAKRVSVAGRRYSLNDLENEVIRPRFKEPRIHFALNCASVGCPPLRPAAYTADSLEHQMNANCRVALNSSRYLRIEGTKIRATKIFDWYKSDFVDAMGVREFMSRYVPDNWARKLTDLTYKLQYLDYDWTLNAAP